MHKWPLWVRSWLWTGFGFVLVLAFVTGAVLVSR